MSSSILRNCGEKSAESVSVLPSRARSETATNAPAAFCTSSVGAWHQQASSCGPAGGQSGGGRAGGQSGGGRAGGQSRGGGFELRTDLVVVACCAQAFTGGQTAAARRIRVVGAEVEEHRRTLEQQQRRRCCSRRARAVRGTLSGRGVRGPKGRARRSRAGARRSRAGVRRPYSSWRGGMHRSK